MGDSPVFRRDVLTGAYVALAPGRRMVFPPGPRSGGLPEIRGRCPFCPGHEADTEATIAAIPEEGQWRVRVVRNLYAIADANACIDGARPLSGEAVAALGAHEVLVEAREHEGDLGDFTLEQTTDVVRMYRDRTAALERIPGMRQVYVFRNRGRRAGSSQPHPHGQIVATCVPGRDPEDRLAVARAHHAAHGRSLLDDVLERELAAGERVVETTDRFVIVCPFAPLENWHVSIVPRSARGSFSALADDSLAELAGALQRTIRRMSAASGGADYNLVVRLPPVAAREESFAFWYVDVLPRRGGGAGFELSSGMPVVTVMPEEAAAAMRSAEA